MTENLSGVRMKYRAAFLKVLCACMVILMQGSDAGQTPKKNAAGVSCRPKELTALAKSLVKTSLARFDEANGKSLGNWSEGFPELEVQQNSTFNGSKVHCSLVFMARGLENILEDQRQNLNPGDLTLHEKLQEAINRVNMLAACVKEISSTECSPAPPPPKMPKSAFDRKQWSHTLLKMARDYLDWLQHKFPVHMIKGKGKNKMKRIVYEETRQRYFEGSGHLL